jgi:hypothetical protein
MRFDGTQEEIKHLEQELSTIDSCMTVLHKELDWLGKNSPICHQFEVLREAAAWMNIKANCLNNRLTELKGNL